MPESVPNHLPPTEVTLPEIVREVRRYLYHIVAVTAIAGVITVIYLLMLPNVYESKAGLVIRAPEVELTGEAAPLSPEMLLALTESLEVKWSAYKLLADSGTIDKDFDFRAFQRALQTTVERKTGVQRELIPMVHLSAKAKDPDTASKMADQWAEAVLERSRAIYKEGVGDLSKFVGEVSEKADTSRNKAEIELASKTLQADMELNKQKLTKQLDQCIAYESEILTLTSTLQSNERLIKELRTRVTEQEKDGVWIGELMETEYRLDGLEPLEVSSVTSTDDILGRIRRRVKDYVDRQKELKEFKKKSGYDALKLEYDGYSKELTLVLADLASASREIVVAEKRFKVLDELKKQVPEKIVLNKAITDDALWQAYLQGNAGIGKATATLKTEVENRLYQEVGSLYSDAMVAVQTSVQKLKAYQQRRQELVRLIADLRERLDLLDQQMEAKTDGIARSKAMLEILRSTYDNDRKELSELRLKVQRDISLLRIKVDILTGLNKEREQLARKVSENEIQLKVLDREVKKLSGVADSLASKAEEVQLSDLASEQASRSGVQMLYKAEPNPQKVGPARAKILLLVTFLVFAGGVFLVASRLFLGLSATIAS